MVSGGGGAASCTKVCVTTSLASSGAGEPRMVARGVPAARPACADGAAVRDGPRQRLGRWRRRARTCTIFDHLKLLDRILLRWTARGYDLAHCRLRSGLTSEIRSPRDLARSPGREIAGDRNFEIHASDDAVRSEAGAGLARCRRNRRKSLK